MPAANPKEAATNWERKTQMGVAKYLAKIPQMPGLVLITLPNLK